MRWWKVENWISLHINPWETCIIYNMTLQKCMTLYYIFTPLRATADAHLELNSIKKKNMRKNFCLRESRQVLERLRKFRDTMKNKWEEKLIIFLTLEVASWDEWSLKMDHQKRSLDTREIFLRCSPLDFVIKLSCGRLRASSKLKKTREVLKTKRNSNYISH